jgi:molybdate transport system substrate-binding protein
MSPRLLLSALALLFCLGRAFAADPLLVAAGAGYRKPVLELLEAFGKETGQPAEGIFGNMKQIETQTRQNDRVLLMIGDRAYLEPLGIAERFVPLGQGRLVLITPPGHKLAGLEELRAPAIRKIAVPDRSKAIYGKAAFACLQQLGLLPELDAKLLEVATVPQVSVYVTTGEVDAGFVNLTEALADGPRIGGSLAAPTTCYAPIEISVGLVSGRAPTPAVRAFLDYLVTPAARQLLERHGL